MRRAGIQSLACLLSATLAARPTGAAVPLYPVAAPGLVLNKGSTRLLVAVVPLDARARALAGQLEHSAELAVDASDRFEAVRGVDAFDPSAAAGRAARQADALRDVAEAKRALEDLDSARAAKLYAEAVAAWKQADLTRGIDGLVEAQIGKAAGHSVSEENREAKAELNVALVLSPKAVLSDAQFPPELLKYAEAQRKAQGRAKGRLTIRSEPASARVWVDGVYRGLAPVTVEGVASVPHLVVAGVAGSALTTVDLSPGDHLLKLKAAELASPWVAAQEKVAADPEGSAREVASRELASLVRADQVLWLVARKAPAGESLEVTLSRFDASGRVLANASTTASVSSGGEQKPLTDWVKSSLGGDDGAGPLLTARPTAASGGVGPLKVLGISLLGLAAVAAGSWGVFGYNALNRAEQYRATPQIEAMISNQVASSGRTFALIADASWAVGAACLVVGLVLLLLPSGSGGGARPATGAASSESDVLREYRRQQEEQRRLEEERAKKGPAESPSSSESKSAAGTGANSGAEAKPADPKPEEPKAGDSKPSEPAASPAAAEEKKKTPEEERAEKKRKAEEERKRAAEEKAEKKRKAEEEKAEKKRKAEEEKAEKKRKAEEEKQKAAEEKRRAEEEKQKASEEKRRADEEKQKAADAEAQKLEEEKKRAAEEQRKADEAEARKADEERQKREEEQQRREEERRSPKDGERPKADESEDDLRNF